MLHEKTFNFTIYVLTSTAVAGSSQDKGVVSRVYVIPQGAIALKLKNGFPNAIETAQCPENNGWAGINASDPVLKSAILTAKTTGSPLTVNIIGCEGAWFKILNIYMD